MIRFFHNIRHNLLGQGKSGKYLKYAIGEILLVMIGILLALQVNNWNEVRKQSKADIEFLKNLKTELVLDTTNLGRRLREYEKRNERIIFNLKLLDTASQITYDQYSSLIEAFISMEILTPIGKNLQKNDIEIANGSITRINPRLNAGYLAYLEFTNSNNEIITKLGETLQDISTLYVMPEIDRLADSITFNQSEYLRIKQNRSLKNSLDKSISSRMTHILFMRQQLDIASKLLMSVNHSLSQND